MISNREQESVVARRRTKTKVNERTTLADGTVINLDGMWSLCERCKKLKAMSEFGMRRMKPGGEIRRQPYCKKCRHGRSLNAREIEH
jgi:hypothetical protein